jgi:hypothetical protein
MFQRAGTVYPHSTARVIRNRWAAPRTTLLISIWTRELGRPRRARLRPPEFLAEHFAQTAHRKWRVVLREGRA